MLQSQYNSDFPNFQDGRRFQKNAYLKYMFFQGGQIGIPPAYWWLLTYPWHVTYHFSLIFSNNYNGK